MTTAMPQDIVARGPTIAPSPVRRAVTTGLIAATGLLMIWLGARGLAASPAAGGATLALGIAALVAARAVWRGMRGALILTPQGLTDDRGRMICPLAEIERVDTGILSLRPSGGFLLHLARPAPPGWVPGLWWRRGRRMGVGGAVARAEARAMAEAIAAMVASRAAAGEPGT
ncbi:MAG: hypothetical protein KatS3mg118_1600 [Paracoccaceae bacterium]|nr:MAG: hypothetical protein KatS3mg118_1600 [Paracoccaceae bacterium]